MVTCHTRSLRCSTECARRLIPLFIIVVIGRTAKQHEFSANYEDLWSLNTHGLLKSVDPTTLQPCNTDGRFDVLPHQQGLQNLHADSPTKWKVSTANALTVSSYLEAV